MKRSIIGSALVVALSGISFGAAAQEDPEGGDTSAESSEASAELSTGDVAAPSSSGGVPGGLRLYGGLRLGFGGSEHFDPDGPGASSDDDLKVTIGGQVGADYVLMDYFAIGGELRLAGLTTDTRDKGDVGRDVFIDIDVKPRGRYVLSSIPLELYGTLPLGLTLINTDSKIDDSVSQGPGFNLGIGGGATYFFADNMGVNLELMGLLYWFGSKIDTGAGKFEGSNRVGQFNMFANFVYAL